MYIFLIEYLEYIYLKVTNTAKSQVQGNGDGPRGYSLYRNSLISHLLLTKRFLQILKNIFIIINLDFYSLHQLNPKVRI